jgi:hypothetical protein
LFHPRNPILFSDFLRFARIHHPFPINSR